MLVIFAFLLAIIPAVAILSPFVLKKKLPYLSDEEIHLISPISDWESAIFDLKNLELEFAIGNLTKGEYDSLRTTYMSKAAQILRSVHVSQNEQSELLVAVESEMQSVRNRLVGNEGQQIE